jgi:hypothetical protein
MREELFKMRTPPVLMAESEDALIPPENLRILFN